MKSKFEKILRGSLFVALSMLLFALPGCPADEGDGLVEGTVYEAEIQTLDDGTLYAIEIEPSDGEDEEEDGETEEEEDGDDDGEIDTGFSVQIDAIADDRLSFTVFGTLTVVLDLELGDPDDETLLISDLAVGMWIEAEGELAADGVFHAEEIEAADEEESEIEAVLENLTDTTFTMLGLTISYDEGTEIDGDEEEEEVEEEDD